MPKLIVERSILIQAPAGDIYSKVRDLHQWPKWSPWLVVEREAKLVFAEDGRSYSWDGEIIGSGDIHLLDEQENQSLKLRLTILKPWKSQSDVSFTFSEEDGGTRVTWRMDGSLPFFMFFMKGMMEAFIGIDYERGLGMLKDLVELGGVTSSLSYDADASYPGCQYVGIRRSCSIAELGDRLTADFKTLGEWACANPQETSAKPITIYSKWELVKARAEYTVGIPVAQIPETLPDGFMSGELPACRAYSIEHVGPYRHLSNAWSAGICRSRAKLFKQSKRIFPFEVYETDPESAPEEVLVTKVYFPLQ